MIEEMMRYSDADLAEFKEIILNKIEKAQSDLELIKSAYNALFRVENKTYGVCKVTGKLIGKERLKIVPHATMSIEAKNLQR